MKKNHIDILGLKLNGKKEMLNSKLVIEKEGINELEDKSEWITENSIQRNKDMENRMDKC